MVTEQGLIEKTLGAFYACLDFYAMMQQVSYLKQFSTLITFQPFLRPEENIRLLATTNCFKQALCKHLQRTETVIFYADIIKRSSSSTNSCPLTFNADKYQVANLLKKCILGSLRVCKQFNEETKAKNSNFSSTLIIPKH